MLANGKGVLCEEESEGSLRQRSDPTNRNHIQRRCRRISLLNKLKSYGYPGSCSRGWVNYFKYADARSHLKRIDQWVRSRLRYCIWMQWKRVRTRYKALRKLGASHHNAYMWANTRKGGWHTAHSYVLTGTITNARLRQKGYTSLVELYSNGS